MANMLSIEISSCARSFGQLGLGDTLGETDDFSSEGRRERRPFVILGRCTPTWIKMMKDHDVCHVCCGGDHTALLTKASSSSSSERKSSEKIIFYFILERRKTVYVRVKRKRSTGSRFRSFSRRTETGTNP